MCMYDLPHSDESALPSPAETTAPLPCPQEGTAALVAFLDKALPLVVSLEGQLKAFEQSRTKCMVKRFGEKATAFNDASDCPIRALAHIIPVSR